MQDIYTHYFKRLIDCILSFLLLILLCPLLLIIAIILSIYNKRDGVFFFQHRVGMNGKIFRIIKFKTMRDLKDRNDNLLSDDKRLTEFGKFLRTFSLDELPQIINVLIGDMSFIGPRPLLVDYLPLYNSEQARRHEVRPGITGWAQIKGRNSITWKEKFKYDIWYIDNVTFFLDLYIGVKTFLKIIEHKDISYEHEATMHYFDGTN